MSTLRKRNRKFCLLNLVNIICRLDNELSIFENLQYFSVFQTQGSELKVAEQEEKGNNTVTTIYYPKQRKFFYRLLSTLKSE